MLMFDPRRLARAWTEYRRLLALGRPIRRLRALLDLADGYASHQFPGALHQARLIRLYRHVALRSEAMVVEAEGLVLGVERMPANQQAHEAFSRLLVPRRRFHRILLCHATLVAALAGAMLLLLSALSRPVHARLFQPELAVGRPWRVSATEPSFASSGTIQAPKAALASGARFFFHTKEMESPWIEIDLGSFERVSKITVVNRADCCLERPLPLEVSLGLDGVHWTKVAQRRGVFETWTVEFKTQLARYVRLSTPRRTMLHFQSISVR
jgi:hypothetical protein